MTLLIETPVGTLYLGPLDQAKVLVRQDRHPKVTVNRAGHRTVEFHDDPEKASVAEFGSHPDQHMAWRYALGAYFGPLDEEYDEAYLQAALDAGRWGPMTPPARFTWWGWAEETDLDNDDDREDVWFLTIVDSGEEMATIVHRTCGGRYPLEGPLGKSKEANAQLIVDALNEKVRAS